MFLRHSQVVVLVYRRTTMNKALKSIVKVLSKILLVISGVALLAGTLLTFFVTISRYGFGVGYDWAEELIRYLMIMATFFMCGPVMMRNGHVSMTLVVNMIKSKKTQKIIDAVANAILAVVSLLICKWGMELWITEKGVLSYTHSWPMRFPHIFLPIGMAVLALYCIIRIILVLTDENGIEDLQDS